LTVSGLGTGAGRRFRCGVDNHPLFPDVCAESGKWFRRAPELFRGPGPDETIVKKIQSFQPNTIELGATLCGSLNQPVVHWPTQKASAWESKSATRCAAF
jgi:hypothetical protein